MTCQNYEEHCQSVQRNIHKPLTLKRTATTICRSCVKAVQKVPFPGIISAPDFKTLYTVL